MKAYKQNKKLGLSLIGKTIKTKRGFGKAVCCDEEHQRVIVNYDQKTQTQMTPAQVEVKTID